MPIYVNVDGAQKVLSDVYANIDGAQRRVTTMYANIGGSQKNLMGYKWAKYYAVYKQKRTQRASLHLYSINGGFIMSYSSHGADVPFDTQTGYFSYTDEVLGSFKYMPSPTANYYYFVGYGENTDGKICHYSGSDILKSGVMAYMIWPQATVTLDSDNNGATFDNTSYPNVIYSSEQSTTEHGDFIEYVTSNDETAYPDNGLQGKYWYIRQ